ncbi:hypothetical protein PDESU_02371 [Pontiella desulfatans]|uniref:Uncharacterized protein n=1 Tax=Pontiella desulfatans TaxID=2750659 RepID=A0A6C2U2D0_PONDE|nr:hypothetical protein [Pontiella desulfatans]VGO13814.1 hypothetical protein PDESU_02371 [Pontiella desulfatans]
MQAPQWNTEDKGGSLRKWIVELNVEARRQFLEAGTHVEIFFIFNDEGLVEVVPIVGMDKDEMIRELKKMLAERSGYAFIHIAEATARHMDSAAKTDALLLHAESRDGLCEAWISTVVLRGDEKLLLDEVRVEGSRIDGRFAGIFRDID